MQCPGQFCNTSKWGIIPAEVYGTQLEFRSLDSILNAGRKTRPSKNVSTPHDTVTTDGKLGGMREKRVVAYFIYY
jgi:hypothetical protein